MSGIKRSSLVVYARVEKHVENRKAMTLKPVKILRGTTESGELLVYGDNGMLCRPYVSKFPEETEWVFSLVPAGNAWAIEGCRENWLVVKAGQLAQGNIARGVKEVSIDDLEKRLKELE